jgi:hypothetical protein
LEEYRNKRLKEIGIWKWFVLIIKYITYACITLF